MWRGGGHVRWAHTWWKFSVADATAHITWWRCYAVVVIIKYILYMEDLTGMIMYVSKKMNPTLRFFVSWSVLSMIKSLVVTVKNSSIRSLSY